jgi:nucleoside-diphosphate-sugar epimerase
VLSGKSPIDLRDMLSVIAKYLGKPARFISFPYWFAITGAWGLYLLSITRIDYREKVQRLVEPRAYSHDDATNDFGYDPISFQDGVKEEVEAYLSGKKTQ